MTDRNAGTNRKWTRYIIPAVILVLCCTAMTNAVYAYSSGTTTSGNTLTANSEILTISDGESATIAEELVFVYYSTTVRGETTWNLDIANSQVEPIFDLTLQSSTRETKTVTITVGDIILGGVSLTPIIAIIDDSGTPVKYVTGHEATYEMTPTGESSVAAGEQTVSVCISVLECLMTLPSLTGTSTTFTITASTSD